MVQEDSDRCRLIAPHQISSSAWDLPLVQAREIAYAALRLYEGIEAESWSASYHLEIRLQAFQQRMIDALSPQPTATAESAASTPEETLARVIAKREFRKAAIEADPWRGEMDEPAEAFGGGPT